MVDAGARVDLPLVGRNGALIADGERNEHARVRAIGQRGQYPRAQHRRARARPSIAAGAPSPRAGWRRSGRARSRSRADCAPGATPRNRSRADSPCRAAGAGAPSVASARPGRDPAASPACRPAPGCPTTTARCGPARRRPRVSTRSTSNSKRTLRSDGCGRPAITPSMRMSRPFPLGRQSVGQDARPPSAPPSA